MADYENNEEEEEETFGTEVQERAMFLLDLTTADLLAWFKQSSPCKGVPAAVEDHLQKIAAAGEDKDEIARISIEIAADTIRGLRSVTKGIHVMAIGWEQHIPAMLEQSQN